MFVLKVLKVLNRVGTKIKLSLDIIFYTFSILAFSLIYTTTERDKPAQSIKQPINQSFKSIVEETRIPLAIGPAVYPLRAEQVVGVTPTDNIGTRYAR